VPSWVSARRARSVPRLPSPTDPQIVTVLFVDMVDSTALADELDAESFRALMEHYFQATDEVVAYHGGTSRSSSGRRDGRLRYPEAPRGRRPGRRDRCRGAPRPGRGDERGFLRAYGRTVAIRTGVESGEAVARERGRGELYVTRPTVNTAARLEQAAAPG
jgi:class 3 adenylate cyclase